jgi:hypothetical protein
MTLNFSRIGFGELRTGDFRSGDLLLSLIGGALADNVLEVFRSDVGAAFCAAVTAGENLRLVVFLTGEKRLGISTL